MDTASESAVRQGTEGFLFGDKPIAHEQVFWPARRGYLAPKPRILFSLVMQNRGVESKMC